LERKVEIVNKFVSDKTSGNCVTLDDVLGGGGVNFIKADIEGAEVNMLRGASKILSTQKNLRLSLCTYHNINDGCELKEILKNAGFSTKFSDGYKMLLCGFDYSDPPYLRRGLISSEKAAPPISNKRF
jgi:hypothetical protein